MESEGWRKVLTSFFRRIISRNQGSPWTHYNFWRLRMTHGASRPGTVPFPQPSSLSSNFLNKARHVELVRAQDRLYYKILINFIFKITLNESADDFSSFHFLQNSLNRSFSWWLVNQHVYFTNAARSKRSGRCTFDWAVGKMSSRVVF